MKDDDISGKMDEQEFEEHAISLQLDRDLIENDNDTTNKMSEHDFEQSISLQLERDLSTGSEADQVKSKCIMPNKLY